MPRGGRRPRQAGRRSGQRGVRTLAAGVAAAAGWPGQRGAAAAGGGGAARGRCAAAGHQGRHRALRCCLRGRPRRRARRRGQRGGQAAPRRPPRRLPCRPGPPRGRRRARRRATALACSTPHGGPSAWRVDRGRPVDRCRGAGAARWAPHAGDGPLGPGAAQALAPTLWRGARPGSQPRLGRLVGSGLRPLPRGHCLRGRVAPRRCGRCRRVRRRLRRAERRRGAPLLQGVLADEECL
mmetsp:Transcript_102173/g.284541  ORF Transcript_102173/g.284541 Transcript_102173/m.284541 type:complete len:238 (-) Transcript_102173:84-797(-)